ncbi:MAG: hypothetical protein AAFY66_01355 [Pseudomonadota bacterium]
MSEAGTDLTEMFDAIRAMSADRLDRLHILMRAWDRGAGEFSGRFFGLGEVQDGPGACANDVFCQQLAGVCCEDELASWKRLSSRRLKAGDDEGMKRLEQLMQLRLRPVSPGA